MDFNAEKPDTVSVLAFDYDGAHYVAEPEPEPEEDECAGCDFHRFPYAVCRQLPSCSHLMRPDGKGVIWVKAPQFD